MVKPFVNQILAYQAPTNGATGISSKPILSLWILDLGATNHIICSSVFFASCIPVVNLFVELP